MGAAGKVIKVNVGGTVFQVSRDTLERKDGLLASLSRGEHSEVLNSGDGSSFFLDRDPKHFQTILGFLRDGEAVVPTSSDARRELRLEAAFYRLDELVEAVDQVESKYATSQEVLEAGQLADAFLKAERAEQVKIAGQVVKAAASVLEETHLREQATAVMLEEADQQLQQWQNLAAVAADAARAAELEPAVRAQVPQQVQAWSKQQATRRQSLATVREEVRKAEAALRQAELVKLCALGFELHAAEAQLAARQLLPRERP